MLQCLKIVFFLVRNCKRKNYFILLFENIQLYLDILIITGELRLGTDESTFNAILVQRNMAQLHEIFAEYANITGHVIEDAIENEFSGDIKKALLAIGEHFTVKQ